MLKFVPNSKMLETFRCDRILCYFEKGGLYPSSLKGTLSKHKKVDINTTRSIDIKRIIEEQLNGKV